MKVSGFGKRLAAALLLAGVLCLAVILLVSPRAHAETPTPSPETSPPLGDCYGGLLSQAPLHCYALEQAEAVEEINIEAIYLIDSSLPSSIPVPSRTLYIYVSEEQTVVENEVYDYLYERMKEYVQKWPPRRMDEGRFYNNHCTDKFGNARLGIEDCLLNDIDTYLNRDNFPPRLFEDYANYARLEVRGGGVEARRTVRGWPSWRQVWPAEREEAGGQTGDGNAGDGGQQDPSAPAFDVSDVDLTNIPDVDCDSREISSKIRWNSHWACRMWQKHPEFRFAGIHPYHHLYQGGTDGKVYYQLKIPVADAEKWKVKLEEWDPGLVEQGWEIVVVPVQHDFGDLWRYATILNRFSHSSANTIGITKVFIGVNTIQGSYWDEQTALMLNNLEAFQPYDPNTDSGYREPANWSAIREVIGIGAHDSKAVADALPTLLPLLDIPASAVGVVYQEVPFRVVIKTRQALGDTDTSNYDPSLGDWGLGVPDVEKILADARELGTIDEGINTTEETSPDLSVAVGNGNSELPVSNAAPTMDKAEVSAPDGSTVEVQPLSGPSPNVIISETEESSRLSPWLLALASGSGALILVAAVLAGRRMFRTAR